MDALTVRIWSLLFLGPVYAEDLPRLFPGVSDEQRFWRVIIRLQRSKRLTRITNQVNGRTMLCFLRHEKEVC